MVRVFRTYILQKTCMNGVLLDEQGCTNFVQNLNDQGCKNGYFTQTMKEEIAEIFHVTYSGI